MAAANSFASHHGCERVPEPESRMLLRDVPWGAYVALADADDGRRYPRLCYVNGNLELMSPTIAHEPLAERIADLLKQYMLHHDIDYETFRSATLREEGKRRGAEADASFGVGGAATMPNLVIEVVLTNPLLDKGDLYATLGVSELWTASPAGIAISVLEGGKMVASPGNVSRLLPALDVAELFAYTRLEPTSRAIRAYQSSLAR